MNHCPNCGSKFVKESNFCHNCGLSRDNLEGIHLDSSTQSLHSSHRKPKDSQETRKSLGNTGRLIFGYASITFGVLTLLFIFVNTLDKHSATLDKDAKVDQNSNKSEPDYLPGNSLALIGETDRFLILSAVKSGEPTGNAGTESYFLGRELALRGINEGVLDSFDYSGARGSKSLCGVMLEEFIKGFGINRSKQEYADFFLGCRHMIVERLAPYGTTYPDG